MNRGDARADGRHAVTGEPSRRGSLLFFVALLLLVALFLGRACTGELFVSTETVWRTVQPWSGVQAPPPSHNENLADQPTVWYPMQALTRAMIRSGEPPLYTYESYAGAPWLANMSSALFSPFTWLFVVLPFEPAFAVCAALKWVVAGVGAWLLARRLGAGAFGSALAGIVFAFCGFQVVWIDACLTNVSVLAPWLLLALERLFERPRAGRTLAFALLAWQVLVGGHPETSLYVAMGAAVFAAGRFGAVVEKRRALVSLAVAVAAAALLAAPQWLPFLDYALHSYGHALRLEAPNLIRPLIEPTTLLGVVVCVAALLALVHGVRMTRRDDVRSGWKAIALLAWSGLALRATGLRPTLALELLPDWYGRPIDGGVYGGPLTYNDVTAGFCGAATFALALATVIRGASPALRALALAALVACARFLRVPLLSHLLDTVPQIAQTGSTRALAFGALAVALLAGAGASALVAGIDATDTRRIRRALVAGLFLVAGALAPLESFAVPARTESTPDLFAAGEDGLGATLRGRCPADVDRVAILANGRTIGEVAATPPVESKADGTWTWRWFGSHRLEESLVEVRTRLRHRGGPVAGEWTDGAVWPLDLTRTPRPDVRWLVPLVALGSLFAALRLGSTRARAALLGAAVVVDLALFGIDYNATTPRDRVPAAVEPIPLLQQDRVERGPARIFAARTALHPSLHALFGLEVMRGYDALEPLDYVRVLGFLQRPGAAVPWTLYDFSTLALEAGTPSRGLFDFLGVRWVLSEERPPAGFVERWRRGTLALHENPDALPRAFTLQRWMGAEQMYARGVDPRTAAAWDEPGEGSYGGSGRVVAFTHGRGSMHATVQSDEGTILVVTENAGGFRATIDGASTAIRRTHGSFLSVVVPAGRHEVELRYLPAAVVRGAIAGGAGSVGVLLLAILALRRRSAAGS